LLLSAFDEQASDVTLAHAKFASNSVGTLMANVVCKRD